MRTECKGDESLLRLVKSCWDQSPRSRPSFVAISKSLDPYLSEDVSFGDFIATQMEEYSEGLDSKVKGKTAL